MAGTAFHEVRFPTAIALGASGGPTRRTEIVSLGSGHEQRNQRWAQSRRRYDAGFGIRSLDDLYAVIAFFEGRAGRLYGFRFSDPVDRKSCMPGSQPTPLDQFLGVGDGSTSEFQLVKVPPEAVSAVPRPIVKPVAGTVRVAVDGVEKAEGVDFSVDATTGVIAFGEASIPPSDAVVTAGFEFDVPVRFDTDEIRVNLVAFEAGDIPSIPLIEVFP